MYVYSETSYVQMAGRAVYNAMIAADPDAIWYVTFIAMNTL